MPAKGIRVDGSFNCAIRTTSTIVTASGTNPPQPIPERPMRGRRVIRIYNNGETVNNSRSNVDLVIGNRDVFFLGSAMQGYGLKLDEFIELPFDDAMIIYAIIDSSTGDSADLRSLELR